MKETPVGRRQPDYLPDAGAEERARGADAEIKRLEKALETETPEPGRGPAHAGRRRCSRVRLPELDGARARGGVAPRHGTRVLIQGNDFSIIATTAAGPKPPRDTYTVRFKTDLQGITAFRLEALTFEELPQGGPGRDPDGGFVVSEMVVRDADGTAPSALRNASASTPAERDPARPRRGHRRRDVATEAGRSTAADGESHRLVVEAAEPRGRGRRDDPDPRAPPERGSVPDAGPLPALRARRAAGEVGTAPGPESTLSTRSHRRASPPAERTEEQRRGPHRASTAASAPELAAAARALRAAELREGRPAARSALLARHRGPGAGAGAHPAPRQLAGRVGRGRRARRPAFPAAARHRARRRATRLDLARWLTSRENPLTARVFVNRLWKLFFGQGLSRTLEDLGSQGEWPTHPELLDWLAVEFMESGWDVKHVVRTLVTSATYRQSSRPRPSSCRARPLTTASTPARPASASTPRWSATTRSPSAASSRRRSGARASTPTSPTATGPTSTSRRGSGTTPRARTSTAAASTPGGSGPSPSRASLAFDAPSREECVAERVRSNVPQQALALLNDPTYVEAARGFAERILRDGGTSLPRPGCAGPTRAPCQRAPNEEESRVLRGAPAQKARTRVRGRPARGKAPRGRRPGTAPQRDLTPRRSSRPGPRSRARS